MCDPVTLGVVSLTMSVIGGGVSAYSQYQQGKYQNQVAKNNATVAGIKAQNELRSGAAEDQQQRWKIRALMGKQSSAIGANNVVGSTGTALEMLGETAMFGEVDLNTIRNNAARRAWGYDVEKSNSLAEGKLAKYGGKMGAFGTLLSTGAQAFGQWSQLPKRPPAKQSTISGGMTTVSTGSQYGGYA